MRIISPVALIIAAISLALNVLLIMRLNQARVGAINALDDLSQEVAGLADFSFNYNVHISQNLSVGGELPFNQDLVIPINTSVPVKTTAHLNMATPLGPVDLPVTIDTSVPLSLSVPISISRTVPYSLAVPVNLDVPISIRARDLGIDTGIQRAQEQIQRFRASLQ